VVSCSRSLIATSYLEIVDGGAKPTLTAGVTYIWRLARPTQRWYASIRPCGRSTHAEAPYSRAPWDAAWVLRFVGSQDAMRRHHQPG
jgi:hypothetical protein